MYTYDNCCTKYARTYSSICTVHALHKVLVNTGLYIPPSLLRATSNYCYGNAHLEAVQDNYGSAMFIPYTTIGTTMQ